MVFVTLRNCTQDTLSQMTLSAFRRTDCCSHKEKNPITEASGETQRTHHQRVGRHSTDTL